ncbi:hypothetical protein [Alkalibacterium pelagium]|uniref:Uncharacterized protein n=1 Tax=Alkalibacterium pelagium TaxID=426702 RepID=A0A1H7LCA4_9LACT|nr:hypothetical protein [Alkalibacterium pelagium]GEN50924.1 hypothetical protein APE02nite_15890 [Alkalibacterium pelagium]SEK96572.1 hypothetical protein SAMN04488099_10939 [Alkalibacterium pelagium]
MKIKVTRPDRFYASLARLKLVVDGEVVGKISNGATEEITVDTEQSVLQVKYQGTRSNKLTVSPGDTVKIMFNKWVYWEPVFTGLITFLSLFIISQLRLHNVLEELSVWMIGGVTVLIISLLIILPNLLYEKYILYKE